MVRGAGLSDGTACGHEGLGGDERGGARFLCWHYGDGGELLRILFGYGMDNAADGISAGC